MKTMLPAPMMFRKRGAQVSSFLDYLLDFKLVRMMYDFIPYAWNETPKRDGRAFWIYGGSDTTLPYLCACHKVLWGAAAVAGTNARPSDRDSPYTSSYPGTNLLSAGRLSLASLAPFVETWELFNPSNIGMYVTIPWKIKWKLGFAPEGTTDLAGAYSDAYNTSVEQVQVQADGSPDLRTMLYRGTALNAASLIQTYGPSAMDPLNPKWWNEYRVMKTKYRWYLPPGGKCVFKMRHPGVKKCYVQDWGTVGTFRYGDYALVFVVKPDLSFINYPGGTYEDTSIMLQSGLAVRRSCHSRSTVYSYMQGRVGFMSNENRVDTAIPNQVISAPMKPVAGMVVAGNAT